MKILCTILHFSIAFKYKEIVEIYFEGNRTLIDKIGGEKHIQD